MLIDCLPTTMKEDCPVLYPNERVGGRIGAYAKTHTTGMPKSIVEYHDRIQDTMPKTANFMISVSEAQALLFLAKTFETKRGELPPTKSGSPMFGIK